MTGLISLVILLGLMYVLLILPQQRRARRHEALVATLEVGDDVLTTAGIYGTIVGLGDEDDDTLLLEVADGVVLRVARHAVAEVAVDEVTVDETIDEVADEDDGDLDEGPIVGGPVED